MSSMEWWAGERCGEPVDGHASPMSARESGAINHTGSMVMPLLRPSAGSWTSRCPPRARLRGRGATDLPRACRPPARRTLALPPGRRWARRRGRRTRSSSSSGARPFGGATRRALHALKYAGERRLAAPLGAVVAERWRRAGAGGDAPRAGPGPRGSAPGARLRPGGADRGGRGGAACGMPWRAAARPDPGDHRPVPPGPPAPGARTWRTRSRSTRPHAAGDRRVAGSSWWTTWSRPGATLAARRPGCCLAGGAAAVSAVTVARSDDRGRVRRPWRRDPSTAAASAAGPCRRAVRGAPWLYSKSGRSPSAGSPAPQPGACTRREVTREDDRQGQEPRGPGPGPAVRGAQVRPPRAAPR